MSTKKQSATRLGIFALGLLALALVLIPPGHARAITFDQWATGRWPGDIAPAYVDAEYADIHSLAGIDNYDWTTTPTTYLSLYDNQITSIESGAFTGLGSLTELWLDYNVSLTELNLEGADFSSLKFFGVSDNTSITSVSLKDAVLNQTSLAALIYGQSRYVGIGGLPGVTELNLSGVDFIAISDLAPLYAMDDLTDLWLVDVLNMDANQLDTLLDNLDIMQSPDTEGILYMLQADYDGFYTAGAGKLAIWDAEPGHHVQIVPEPSTLGLLAVASVCLLLLRRRRHGFRNG